MTTDSAKNGRRDRLARWAALAVLVLLTVGLGAPLLSELFDPPEPLEEPPIAPSPAPTQSVRNMNTRLEWAPGIQTWRHWYVGGSDEHLANLHRQGFGWVKQRFAWADMQPFAPTDAGGSPSQGIDFYQAEMFLTGVERAGPDFKVLIQLDVPPEWALTQDQPPFDTEAFAAFAGAFAARFAGRVHAYEILNEPNLASAWGGEPIPKAYIQVLEGAYGAIKAADPNALVVSAGLSPTSDDFPRAMSDESYLREMYEVMGPGDGGFITHPFDAIGVHAPGFKAAPEVAPEDAALDPALGGQRYFTFRRIEDLRAIAAEYGDGESRFVVTEFGWTTDERPDSPYGWSAVSRAERTDYTRRALQYAADNWADWIGPMFLFTAPDPSWGPDHEAYWRAITDERGWLLDGLSLANLGPEAGDHVVVPADVEEARAIRVDERIPLQVLPVVEMPPSGVTFGTSLAEATRRFGGAVTAYATGADRLALASGRSVVIYDLQAPDGPAEFARTAEVAQTPGALAIEGGLMAVGLNGDQPAVLVFAVPPVREGSAAPGARDDPQLQPADDLQPLATIQLPGRPEGTGWIAGGAPRVRLNGNELLAAQAFCATQTTGAYTPAAMTDDCTLVLHRITDVTQQSPPQEILRTPASLPDPWPTWTGDAVLIADDRHLVAYTLGEQTVEEAGAIDLGGQIWWMGAAGHNVAVLTARADDHAGAGDGLGSSQSGSGSFPVLGQAPSPATLLVVDVEDPARPVLLSSTPVQGNGALRDGDLVAVIGSYCGFPDLAWSNDGQLAVPTGPPWSSSRACSQAQTVLDITYAESPRVLATNFNEELGLPVALAADRLIVAGPLGLWSRSIAGPAGSLDETSPVTAIEPHAVDLVAAVSGGGIVAAGMGDLGTIQPATGRIQGVAHPGTCTGSGIVIARDLAADGSTVFHVSDEGDLVVYAANGPTPRLIGCAELLEVNPVAVAADGDYVYVTGPSWRGGSQVGMAVFEIAADMTGRDVITQVHPREIGSLEFDVPVSESGEQPTPVDLAVAGGRAYIATESDILVVDVADPREPRYLGRLASGAAALVARDDRLYAAVACPAPPGGGQAEADAELEGAGAPADGGEPAGGGPSGDMATDGSVGAAGSSVACQGGLRIFDTPGSGLPRELGVLGSGTGFTALSMPFASSLAAGREALWAAGRDAVWLLDIGDPAAPVVIDGIPARATSLALIEDRLVIAEGTRGVTVVDGAAR